MCIRAILINDSTLVLHQLIYLGFNLYSHVVIFKITSIFSYSITYTMIYCSYTTHTYSSSFSEEFILLKAHQKNK